MLKAACRRVSLRVGQLERGVERMRGSAQPVLTRNVAGLSRLHVDAYSGRYRQTPLPNAGPFELSSLCVVLSGCCDSMPLVATCAPCYVDTTRLAAAGVSRLRVESYSERATARRRCRTLGSNVCNDTTRPQTLKSDVCVDWQSMRRSRTPVFTRERAQRAS